jgi:hypothetical protein
LWQTLTDGGGVMSDFQITAFICFTIVAMVSVIVGYAFGALRYFQWYHEDDILNRENILHRLESMDS